MQITQRKLGYGGTKSEMERLIKDASKMTAVQKELNLTVDEGDMSFGNIVNAISVVQEKLAITGTTAEEAATTIEGSHKAMVAAWDNLKIAFSTGEGLEDAFDNLMEAIFGDGKETGYINQLLPRIEKVFDSIGKYLPQVMSKLADYLPGLLDALKPVLEAIKNAIVSILNSEEFKDAMRRIGESLMGALKDGLDAVGLGGLGDAIQWLWDNRKAIVEVGEILLAAFAGSKLISGVQTVASGIKNIGGALFGSGTGPVPTGGTPPAGGAGGAGGAGITGSSAFSAISAAAPWLVAIEGGREVITHGKELLGAANDWETTVNTANEAFKKGEISAGERAEAIVDQNEKIMDAVQGLYNAPIIGAAMGGNVNTFLNEMVNTAKAKNQELRDEAKSMAANFSDIQKSVIATITGVTGALDIGVDDMTETLHEGFGGMPSDVQALQEGISQTVNYGVDDVVSSLERLRAATNENFDSISDVADATKSDLAGVPSSVLDAMTGASSAVNYGVDDMVSSLERLRKAASRAASSIYEIADASASSLAGVPSDVLDKMAARHYASAVDSPVIFDHPEYAMVGDGTEPEILMGINTFRAMLEQAQSTIQAQVNVNPTSGGTTAQGQERQIIIPVYIGDEKIDEVVVDAVRRQTYLTGGR